MKELASRYAAVDGSRIHYLECGEGRPIIFLHGMPTSSYLWRNILPTVKSQGRCIAPDLIGMGKSDKPDIAYTVFDHIHYIENFIEQLELTDYTLVMHGWGSVIGFDIASRNEQAVNSLAFYEAHVRATTDWEMLSLPIQQFASLLDRPKASYHAIVEQNYLVRKLLPSGVIRTLTAAEMQAYEEPFKSKEDRKPLWQYIQELPLGKTETEVTQLIVAYNCWLQKTTLPKLMFYALPGFITTMESVNWAREHLQHITFTELPHALHFAQESMPEVFAKALVNWLKSCPK